MENKDNTWKNKKRGNKAGFLFFEIIYRVFGLGGCYFFLYLVIPYYLIFDRDAVQSITPYIRRKFPKASFFVKYVHIFNVFINLGKYLVDRYVYLLNEASFNVDLEEREVLLGELEKNNTGLVIITSHIGNWQLVIQTLKHLKRTVHIVMREEENKAAQQALRLNTEMGNIKIITPTVDNFGGVIDMMNALKRGDIVAIAGDRSYGTEVTEVNFLNDSAFFPYTGFKLAAEQECPVAILLASRIKKAEYTVNLSNILYPKYFSKKNKPEQLRPWVQRYVDIISEFLDKNPYDCFIFYNIWKK